MSLASCDYWRFADSPADSLDPDQDRQIVGLNLDPNSDSYPGSEVIFFFSCSTQLSTKFILLINVKMPTIVGILTFISMVNTTSESLKARKVSSFQYFLFFS